MAFVLDIFYQAWLLALQSAGYLLLGFLLAGLIHAFLPADRVARWLGKPGWRSVLNAALIGTPLPLCSCSVVPVAATLRRSGASRGATASFLISTPESGVDSILATWALLDPVMTIARPVAAFLTAFVAGMAENLIGTPDEVAKPRGPVAIPVRPPGNPGMGLSLAVIGAPPPAFEHSPSVAKASSGESCCSHTAAPREHAHTSDASASCCAATASPPATSLVAKIGTGLRYAFVGMFEDMGRYLLVGFVLAGLIAALLTRLDVLQAALTTPWAPVLMLLAGIPLYVCASSATPLIAVLISQGLSPGAGLVFLLSGPATNAASIVLLRQIIGGRGVVIYLASIAVCALAAGYSVDGTYALLNLAPRALVQAAECHTNPGWVAVTAAVILCLLTANGMIRRALRR